MGKNITLKVEGLQVMSIDLYVVLIMFLGGKPGMWLLIILARRLTCLLEDRPTAYIFSDGSLATRLANS